MPLPPHGGGHPVTHPAASRVTGGDIATFALKYKGVPYVWGGYLPSGWDCSGFVNYVLGHHFGLKLPGGYTWSGKGHGPVASMYKVWGKAHNVSTAQAGDLCVWLTHIGIAVNSHQMISALDPAQGTQVTAIAGPSGESLTVRRVNTVGAIGGGGGGSAASSATGCTTSLIFLPYLIAKGVILRATGRDPSAEQRG